MKINKKYGDKVYIEWVDAYTDGGWKSYEDMIKIGDAPHCFTNAWYVGENKDFVIVCHTKGINKKEDMMGKLVIPKKWIKKVR